MNPINPAYPANPLQSIVALLEAAEGTLQYYAGSGCHGFPCSKEALHVLNRWASPDCLTGRCQKPGIATDPDSCLSCPLYNAEDVPIPGTGKSSARIMFIPGYPSRAAAAERDPFAGEDGALFSRIISAGMKLSLDDVCVRYLVRCCPGPGTPLEAAMERCRGRLEEKIVESGPAVICTLGDFAARSLLKTGSPLSVLRAEPQHWQGIRVVPTWHPSDIIEDTSKKREVWEDVKTIMKIAGLPV
ncbi:MAG: uracil-DNA glycosylase [Thermodesulfobacteriota bacterium]|nr:uracil-DNA glycosylase [Thermodesulfobacteriota bacterium]